MVSRRFHGRTGKAPAVALTPEFEQRVEVLFQSALKLDPVERIAFLNSACTGNASLRREIESRLAAFAVSPDVGESQSLHQSQNPNPSITIGELISHYKTMSFLGRGGMGEVFLAQDTRLGRKVALKLLPKALSNDEDRLRRFEREA